MKNKKLNKKLVAGVLATTIALGSASLPASAVSSRNVQISRLPKLSRVGAVAPKLNIQQFELVLDAGVKNGTFSKSEVVMLKNKLGCGLVSRGVLRGLISAMTIKEKASLTAVQGRIETMATNAVKDTKDAVEAAQTPETAIEAAAKALVMADIIESAGDAVSVATQLDAAQAAEAVAQVAVKAAHATKAASAAVEAAVAATRIAKIIIARAANGDEVAQAKAEVAAEAAGDAAAVAAHEAAAEAVAAEAALAAAKDAAEDGKYTNALENITTALGHINQAVVEVKKADDSWKTAAEQIESDAKKAFSANRTLLTLYKLDYQKAKIKVDILTLLQIMLGFKVEDERAPH